jgi:hypothetical protein
MEEKKYFQRLNTADHLPLARSFLKVPEDYILLD